MYMVTSNLAWNLSAGRTVSLGLLICLTTFLGCGGAAGTGSVEGKVSLNGQPYTDAAVVLLSLETGQAGSADIQADGSFRLENRLPVGTYKVYLAPKTETSTDEPVPVTVDQSVPSKYWNEASTDITVEIGEGDNQVEVPLQG
jgi:hypothetical protein